MANSPRITDWNVAPDYTDAAFEPYALALGQIALAWNNLHEMFGRIFWTICNTGFGEKPMAIWNSIKSDRAQREMLEAALEAETVTSPIISQSKLDDILWLLRRAESMEERRNNAVHSPLITLSLGDHIKIVPSHHFGHKRASKLKEADILREFHWCRNTIISLRSFAIEIDIALMDPGLSWPDKPQLPNRGDSRKKTNAQNPQQLPKEHQSPLQSSPQ